MLSFFKSNNPGVVVFYLVYLVAFRICFVFVTAVAETNLHYYEPLATVIEYARGYLQAPLIPLLVLGAVLQFIQAIIVNRLVNENKMISRKTYMPGVIFIILSSFVPQALVLSPLSLALTFTMLAVAAVFRLTKKEKAYGDVFDVGFLSSIAVLLYFPSVVLILFAYISLGSLRPFRMREWLAALFGFVTPLFVAFVAFYVTESTPENFLPAYSFKHVGFKPEQWIQAGAFLICAVGAFIVLPLVLQSTLIQVRKLTTLLTVLFGLLIPAFFLQQQLSFSYVLLLSFPVSVITSMLLVQFKNPLVSEVFHLILILLVLAGQFLPFFHIL